MVFCIFHLILLCLLNNHFQVKDHEGDISDFLKQVSAKLSEARDNIKNAIGPDGQKKANELREKFEKGLKEASAQGEKLANAIKPQASSKYQQ